MLALILKTESWKMNGYKSIQAEPSFTSQRQQWDKPRGPNVLPEPMSSMLISRLGNTNRKRKPVMAKYNDNRYTLMSFIYVPFYYKTKQISRGHYTP